MTRAEDWNRFPPDGISRKSHSSRQPLAWQAGAVSESLSLFPFEALDCLRGAEPSVQPIGLAGFPGIEVR